MINSKRLAKVRVYGHDHQTGRAFIMCVYIYIHIHVYVYV